MRIVDLRIHPGLRKWLKEAIEDDSVNFEELLVAKGPLNGEGPDVWNMSVISPEMADEMKSHEDHIYIKADDLVFLLIQPDLVYELEGKFMDWGQDGPCLIDRA